MGGYTFDGQSVDRIRQAVRTVEGQSSDGRGVKRTSGRPDRSRILAQITNFSNDRYSWQHVRLDSGTGIVPVRPVESVETAVELNGRTDVAIDTVVEMFAVGDYLFGFIAGRGAGGMFPVLVDSDGGSGSFPASWTYTVRTLQGTVIGNGLTPDRPRPNTNISHGSRGMAYFDAGVLRLYDAGEITDFEAC